MLYDELFVKIPDIKFNEPDADTPGSEPLWFLAAGNLSVPENGAVTLPSADLSCAAAALGNSGRARSDGNDFILQKSSLAVFDCRGEITLSGDDGGSRFFLLFIRGAGVGPFRKYIRARSADGYSLPLPSGALLRLTEAYDRLSYYRADLMRRLSLLSSVLADAADFAGQPEADPTLRYLAAIKHNFDNEYRRAYSLDMLEHDFHVNKYKIAKDFSAYYGTAPIKYLNARRIEAAKQLLISTNHKINEISSMVGIENVTHFIRLFKQRTGMTPAAFRKTYH